MTAPEAPTPSWFPVDWSIVSVAGPDATKFLHNLCTNDVVKLAEGDACEALFTDVKGKVVAHAVLCRREDAVEVVVTSARAEDLAAHLDRYHIREDLELRVAEERGAAIVFSSGASDVGKDGFRLPALGDDARLVIGARGTQSSTAWGAELEPPEFDALRVERRFPLDGVDVDARNLPQELDRDDALINFNKGCYLGQETVARIDALGRVNQLWRAFDFAGGESPSVGDAIVADEKPIGRLTTVAPLGERWAALGYVRREAAAAGQEVVTSSLAVGRVR